MSGHGAAAVLDEGQARRKHMPTENLHALKEFLRVRRKESVAKELQRQRLRVMNHTQTSKELLDMIVKNTRRNGSGFITCFSHVPSEKNSPADVVENALLGYLCSTSGYLDEAKKILSSINKVCRSGVLGKYHEAQWVITTNGYIPSGEPEPRPMQEESLAAIGLLASEIGRCVDNRSERRQALSLRKELLKNPIMGANGEVAWPSIAEPQYTIMALLCHNTGMVDKASEIYRSIRAKEYLRKDGLYFLDGNVEDTTLANALMGVLAARLDYVESAERLCTKIEDLVPRDKAGAFARCPEPEKLGSGWGTEPYMSIGPSIGMALLHNELSRAEMLKVGREFAKK